MKHLFDLIGFFFADIYTLFVCLLQKFHHLTSTKCQKVVSVNNDLPLYILGNGPSLKNIRNEIVDRSEVVLCTVNFSVNSDLFEELKPEFLVFADPAFYNSLEREDVQSVYKRIKQIVNWKLTIIVNYHFPKWFYLEFNENPNINVVAINNIGWYNNIGAFDTFKFNLIKKNIIGMGCYNVLIQSIMAAINIGFKQIFLYGAEHSWPNLISVGKDNVLYLNDEHYYGKNKRPWYNASNRVPLIHERCHEWYMVFLSYQIIRKYIDYLGTVRIVNKTPNSLIDAFEKD